MTFTRSKLVLACALYVLVLHWAYMRVLVPLYDYEGYVFRAGLRMLLFAWVLALLPSVWMPLSLKRPSQLVYWVLYILVIVPVALVPIYCMRAYGWRAAVPGVVTVGAFGLLALIYRLPHLPMRPPRLERHEFALLLGVISAACYGYIIYVFGFHLQFVGLSDIYNTRLDYVHTLAVEGSYVSYPMDWMGYVLNPLMLAFGLTSRRWMWFVAGLVGQALIFSITGFKTVLFSPIFLVALLVALRHSREPDSGQLSFGRGFGIKAVLTWAAVFFLSTGVYLYERSLTLFALFVDRLTTLPGLLTGYYFEYFSMNPKLMLSHSVLSRWIENPYGGYEPPRLIGAAYFGSSGMYANANLWADAYANFGYLGIAAFTVLFALVLWLYDSAAQDVDFRLAALALGMPAIALANSALLTSLLTHGLGLAIVLMYFMPPHPEFARPAVRGFASLVRPLQVRRSY